MTIEETKKLTSTVFKTKPFYTIDYGDFEKFICQVFGVKKFEFVADQEMSNDSCKTFNVQSEELDEWEKKSLENFQKTGRESFISQVLLTHLCHQGIIPAGNYLINVCW